MKTLELNKIKLIVYDFDGVMTDNTAIVDQNGNESVIVNRSDGLGISLIKKLGIKQIILSTETNNVVQKRAAKLELFCLNGIEDKAVTLYKYLTDRNISLDSVLYVGNDINDLEVMQMVGFSVAPKDAYEPILEIADHVTKAKGGEGVIRELYDLIIQK
jgi:YrbI family 3-deoxy-D-manno-octulosonate 8-phosphate phosphatase